MTAARSFENLCEAHRYPLGKDGSCLLCERASSRNEITPPCPSFTTWTREYKAFVFDEFLLEASQVGDEQARRQRTWEMMQHMVAERHKLAIKRTTPPIVVHTLLSEYLNRRRTAGTEHGHG